MPYDDALEYFIDGVKASPGMNYVDVRGEVAVTAKLTPEEAKYRYIAYYYGPWIYKFGATYVNGAPVTIDAKKRTYTVPPVDGLTYKVNGVAKAGGTYTASVGTTLDIEVEANPGYALFMAPNFTQSYTFPSGMVEATAVRPALPAFDANKYTYTIPTTTGIRYTVNGVTKAAGTYQVAPRTSVGIQATATPGYSLTGAGSWSYTYGEKTVDTTAPTFTATKFTYTIPGATGVRYTVNGAVKAAGTYQVTPGTSVSIQATATPGYILAGYLSWSYTYGKKTVAATKPAFNAAKNTVVIPSVTGVGYSINGVPKNPGTYTYAGSGSVGAKAANATYLLAGTRSWTFDNRNAVTPAKPAFNAARNTVLIPNVPGIAYSINGVVKKSGTHKYAGTGTVTTKASSGSYKLAGTTSWTFDNRNSMTPAKPAFNAARNKVVIPNVPGVAYSINGVAKKPGTYTHAGTGSVAAKAANATYLLAGTRSWTFDNRNAVTPAKPAFNAAKNTVKIPVKTGVNYYINGTLKKAGTHKYAGTVKVTTKVASSSYKLTGTQGWTVKL